MKIDEEAFIPVKFLTKLSSFLNSTRVVRERHFRDRGRGPRDGIVGRADIQMPGSLKPGLLTDSGSAIGTDPVGPVRRYKQLKPGPGLSADEVLANQRARLLGAMVAIVGERGYRAVKVRELSRRAGVSTRSFYQHFSNLEECLAASYAWVMREALGRAEAAALDARPEALQTRLEALLKTFAEHPRAARLALFEACSAGPGVAEKERAALRALERLVGENLGGGPAAFAPPGYVSRGVACAVLWVARRQLGEVECVGVGEGARDLAAWAMTLCDESASCLPPVSRRISRVREPFQSQPSASGGDVRRRILDATFRLAASQGYAELTGPGIRREAGVTRRLFDESFGGVEDCFLEAVEARVLDTVDRAQGRSTVSAEFAEQVVTVTESLCVEVARDPGLAELVFVDLLSLGPEGIERQDRILAILGEQLGTRGDSVASPLWAKASLAAAWGIVRSEVVAGRARHLDSVTPFVSYICLAPFVGAAIAGRMIEHHHL